MQINGMKMARREIVYVPCDQGAVRALWVIKILLLAAHKWDMPRK
jgi:hypothetical protein